MWNPVFLVGIIFGIILLIATLIYALLRKKKWSIWGIILLMLNTVLLIMALLWLTLCLLLSGLSDENRGPQCYRNVQQIGYSLIGYAGVHDGMFPASLGVLMKEGYLTSWKPFICPSSKDRPPEGFPTDSQTDLKKQDLAVLNTVEDWGSYVYVKGLKYENRPDVIVLYEKAGHHGERGRCCFFDDGHVQLLSETEFQDHMKAQETELREMSPKETK
jgi:hypothetical protein